MEIMEKIERKRLERIAISEFRLWLELFEDKDTVGSDRKSENIPIQVLLAIFFEKRPKYRPFENSLMEWSICKADEGGDVVVNKFAWDRLVDSL